MDYKLVQKADKELIYYGIYNTELEVQDGGDILCTVRKRYFETGKRQKNRSTFNILGELYRSSYNMEEGKPLKWKKLIGNQLAERVVVSNDGYFVESSDRERHPYKRAYYDNFHNLLRVEFYSYADRRNPICTVIPSSDGERSVLVRKNDGMTDVLYPFEHVLDKELTQKLNIISGEPQIFCRTNSGSYYFCNEQEAVARQQALEKMLEREEADNMTDIAQEQVEPSFEVNTAALDMPEEKTTERPQTPITETVHPERTEPDEPIKEETVSAEPAEEVIAEEQDIQPDLSIEAFADDTSEFAVQKAPCAFMEECPYENVDKLIIESGGRQYFYFGDIIDDKRSGSGRTAMYDGRTAYEGGYKDDKRDGFGVYYFKSGKLCYAGSWKQNRREGLGIAFSPNDGSAFIGRWHDNASVGIGASFDRDGRPVYFGKTKDGKRDGAGITYSAERDTFFVGKYKDGEFLGTGTQFDSEGNMLYVGGYRGNVRQGEGLSYNGDGSVCYKGEWKNNLYHGEGTLYLEDGCILKGTFRNGKAEGNCRLTDGLGRIIYSGSFANDMYNGTGRLFAEDGGYVEGRFVDGEPTGIFNEYDRDKQLIYCGEWTDMHRSGKGIEYKNGVKVYDGSFVNSVYEGSGKLYRDGQLIYSGGFTGGIRNGLGTEYNGDEVVYFGIWENNSYNGSGILYEGGIPRYAGSFENGKRQGRVNEIYNGKVKRKCIYRDDVLTYMCEYSEDGTIIYFGNVTDGKKSGMGCLYNDFCEKEFEGIFRNDVPEKPMQVFFKELEDLHECEHLSGTDYDNYRYTPEYAVEQEYADGMYTGQLRNGVPHGKGTILYYDHRYTGIFADGKAAGEGIIYMRDGSVIRGEFSTTATDTSDRIDFANVTYYRINN